MPEQQMPEREDVIKMRIEIKKILCPVDFSEPSDHALRYATAFAEAYGSHLTLLHVVELPFLPSYSTAGVPELHFPVDEMQRQCRERMDKLLEEHGNERDTDGDVVVGVPFVEIVKKAKEEEFDLIVLGTHGHSGLKHLIIGSVAEKVVRKAPCPVLSVKHPEHEFVMP